MTAESVNPALAADTRGLDALKFRARINPDAALKDAARQFETLFMNMLLKSMREATPQDGLFDSEQTRFYTSMLDQQLSGKMSERGLGLAEIMVRQLQRGAVAAPGATGEATPAAPAAAVPATPEVPVNPPAPLPAGSTRDFVNRLWPHAAEASRTTGIPAHFIVGHAALESGWGNREIKGADGVPSHNLFGIKAGRAWSGRTVDIATTEYVNGAPQKVIDRFRAYDSYAEAFRDYVNLIRSNPRYAGVIEGAHDAESFARGLQQAGYATDPQYANKLTRVINGNVLRQSLQA